MYIRSLFDANRNVRDPRQQRVRASRPPFCFFWAGESESLIRSSHQILFNETEKLLQKWKHPDPYRPPTAPGGTSALLSSDSQRR